MDSLHWLQPDREAGRAIRVGVLASHQPTGLSNSRKLICLRRIAPLLVNSPPHGHDILAAATKLTRKRPVPALIKIKAVNEQAAAHHPYGRASCVRTVVGVPSGTRGRTPPSVTHYATE